MSMRADPRPPGWPGRRDAGRLLVLAALCCATPVPIRAAQSDPSRTLPAPVPAEPQPPSVLFGPLYRAVELGHVFSDQKSFADAVPRQPPAAIMRAYAAQANRPGFDLKGFVATWFDQPLPVRVPIRPQAALPIGADVSAMWTVLLRQADPAGPPSSLLPLRYPYVVPGGRFSEIYYWDTYFTMLGLLAAGRHDLATDMIRNMASLIDRYGHIPNGNRTYYLSRSEPPFFACMIDLMAGSDGPGTYLAYLPELQREYDYWMDGEAALRPGQAHRRVVELADGTVLNRDWDDRDDPRDESYAEDVATAAASGRPPSEVYRELRAGAETGWDFSSRWLADGRTLATIRVTQLLPVDLNSLLAHMEQTLSHAYALDHDPVRAARYQARAATRIAAIRHLMWDPGAGIFTDYVWTEARPTGQLTAATAVPLFVHLATPAQAARVAAVIRARLLRPGGMATSLVRSGQQWDSPNGWAPMQWMAVIGLRSYGQAALAAGIARSWTGRVTAAYGRSGLLVEKYDVRAGDIEAAGGEYPLQIGFAWTNGVQAALTRLYPAGAGPDARDAAGPTVRVR